MIKQKSTWREIWVEFSIFILRWIKKLNTVPSLEEAWYIEANAHMLDFLWAKGYLKYSPTDWANDNALHRLKNYEFQQGALWRYEFHVPQSDMAFYINADFKAITELGRIDVRAYALRERLSDYHNRPQLYLEEIYLNECAKTIGVLFFETKTQAPLRDGKAPNTMTAPYSEDF